MVGKVLLLGVAAATGWVLGVRSARRGGGAVALLGDVAQVIGQRRSTVDAPIGDGVGIVPPTADTMAKPEGAW